MLKTRLPAPRSSGGMPFEALKLRRSTRAFSERPLEPQVLSDLLWAANGVTRPSGDRTAPLLAAHHGHRHLRRDGRRHLALR
jgi:hypothetical protein